MAFFEAVGEEHPKVIGVVILVIDCFFRDPGEVLLYIHKRDTGHG